MKLDEQIHEIINRETEAWNTKSVQKLLSIFHADAVWVWPKSPNSHNPMDWEIPQGKFCENRWSTIYNKLFENFDLVHNNRKTQKIEVSTEGDGAFAVVDIDTLWRNKESGDEMHWAGRTCKIYTLTSNGWKFIFQTGVLNYYD